MENVYIAMSDMGEMHVHNCMHMHAWNKYNYVNESGHLIWIVF